MLSAYSKSCGYKKFSVYTNTKNYRFQIVPLWRAFSKSSVFVDLFMRISVDGSRIRNNKVAFSNLSGIVWTRPYSRNVVQTQTMICCLSQSPNSGFTFNPWLALIVFWGTGPWLSNMYVWKILDDERIRFFSIIPDFLDSREHKSRIYPVVGGSWRRIGKIEQVSVFPKNPRFLSQLPTNENIGDVVRTFCTVPRQ